jgi:hypothetical protein
LKGIAEHQVSPQQLSASDVPEAVEKLFNAFVRIAYRNHELEERVDGISFWGVVDWLFVSSYDRWVATPNRPIATEFLQIISANLRRETKLKLLIVPVRRTRIEAAVKIGRFLIAPPQETEEKFLETLKAFGFNSTKIRDGLFEHMKVTTGHNLTHRPLVIMPTERDQYLLKEEFLDTFTKGLLPLLRIFHAQFPSDGPSPSLEVLNTLMSDRIFSGVLLHLESGEMMREGLERTGGELALDLILSPDRLKEFRSHGLDEISAWSFESHGKLAGRTRNALSFFSRARDAEIQKDRLQAFISSMIALESLFSRDSKTPLRATLADSVALLIESTVEGRVAASKRLKKLYDRRSEIVHAGNETLPDADLRDSLRFCARSIFETLTLATSWGDCSDEALFEELDRRKFS